MEQVKTAAIVLAAGHGKRMHSKVAKQYLLLKGEPVVVHALPKKKQTNSADAAGNTPVPSEKSPEVNFGVFLVICGILVVLLLLVFLLYQIQQGRHRKRRRKNQSRKVSGDNRNHPR